MELFEWLVLILLGLIVITQWLGMLSRLNIDDFSFVKSDPRTDPRIGLHRLNPGISKMTEMGTDGANLWKWREQIAQTLHDIKVTLENLKK